MGVEVGVNNAGDMVSEFCLVGQADGDKDPVTMLKAGVQLESTLNLDESA